MNKSFYTGTAFRFIFIVAAVLSCKSTEAQVTQKGFENLFTVPLNYVVNYIKTPPVIDGDLNDAAWQQAKWSADFQDIEGELKPKPLYQTNVKMLWDDNYLYIAAKIMDPNVWANLTKHDQVIYHDNDFEIFIDPSNTTHTYFELEYNALNTLFDLFMNKPYRNGGAALVSWNAEGQKSGVKIQGTLNNPKDIDKSWTLEVAIPFKCTGFGVEPQAPAAGSFWRINFSRVEWDTRVVNDKYVKLKDSTGKTLPEHNWVWSNQGAINMHMPERWGYLLFSKTSDAIFTLPYTEKQREYLWRVYYAQKQYLYSHKAYAASLKELKIESTITIDDKVNNLTMEATPHHFLAFITNRKDNTIITLNQEGLVETKNYK